MNVKSKLLLLVLIYILFVLSQQSCYGMDSVRQQHEQNKKAYIELKSKPEIMQDINKELIRTLEPIRRPIERPSPSFIKIKEKTNELLAREQIRPEEIEALRMNLNELKRIGTIQMEFQVNKVLIRKIHAS